MGKNEDIVLKVENLTVSYGPIRALQNINIEVMEGEIVVLLGANGAGKSTLLNAILGIAPVKIGKISFLGSNITHLTTDRIVSSGISLLPEGRGIIPKMRVWENLELGAFHFNKNEIKKHMNEVFDRFSILKERREQIAETLSGGQQQLLSIGRGLMSRPKLMMLDEPSLGLAPVVITEVFSIIEELNRTGYSILLSEQNAHQALKIAHRGYIFEKGQIVLSGKSEELIKNVKVHHAYLGGHYHK